MVGVGSLLVLWALWLAWSWWRTRDLPASRLFLLGGTLAGVAAVAAMEAGWVVTEVGRQPWIVYHVLRTSQAVTASAGVPASLTVLLVVYLLLGMLTVALLFSIARRWRREDQRAELTSGSRRAHGGAPGPRDATLRHND